MLKYGSSNFSFFPYRPQSDIGFRNFNSSVIFDNITIPSGKFPDFSQSYFSTLLEVSGDGVTLGDNAYNTADDITNTTTLSSNPISCLFNKLSNYINDKHTSSIENIAECDQLKNMVFESNQTLSTTLSTNNIYWTKPKNIYNANFGGYTDSFLTRGNEQEQRIQAQKSPFWSAKANKIMWKPILPIFSISEPFPSGSKFKFIFNIDPNWRRRLIFGQNNGASWVVNDAEAAGTVTVNVREMVFYLCLYDANIKLPKTINYKFHEVYSTIKPIQATIADKFSMTIPRGTYKILVTFFDSRVGTDTRYSPTSFNVADIKAKLQELTLSYSGQFFPVEPYNFSDQFFPLLWNQATNTGDILRAYQDYLTNSDSFEDNSGASLSLGEWIAQPIFVHKIVRQSGDLSQNLDITVKGRDTFIANNSILVMCLYVNDITYELDNNNFITSVETEQLI